MKKRIPMLLFLMIVFSFVVNCSGFASPKAIDPEVLLTGDISVPVTVSFYSPEYRFLSRFGKERLNSFNNLIRHLSVHLSIDGNYSKTAIDIDGDPVLSVTEATFGNIRRSVYSFMPDTVYEHGVSSPESSVSAFLNRDFFKVNRMMNDLYSVFEKSVVLFPEYRKNSEENINYKGYGKSVSRVTISFPSDYVKESFPQAFSDLAETEECRVFIDSLIFSGAQKIVLCMDENERIIRVIYDGTLGLSMESMRKISLSWRCLRSDNHKKDDITLKSPANKGFDKYNLSYVRDLDQTDSEHQTMNWDLQLDERNGDEKKKIRYSADLNCTSGILTGEAVFTEKQDGYEKKVTIIPEIQKENESEYSGSIEIIENSGKILMNSMISGLRIALSPVSFGNIPDPATSTDMYTSLPYSESDVEEAVNRVLLIKMLGLPDMDLEFLKQDIPADDWNTVIQSIFRR